MRKTTAAVALCHVIAFAFSASSFSSAQAMPAPSPGDAELSVGPAQWGAETEASPTSEDELLATLLELARPLPTAKTKAEMCETLAAAAQVHELPIGFFVRLIDQESGFNPEVVSHAGAQGVAQFMPSVAEEWGLKNPFDPHAALIASARFLRSLYDQFGNWGLAAAAYNGGMGRVQKWIDKRGKLPEETRNYVMTITGVPADKWAEGKPQIAKFSIPERAPCQEMAYLADAPREVAPPRPRVQKPEQVQKIVQFAAGPPSKTGGVSIVTVKGGTKVATIKVRGASKVAAVKGKIAAPASVFASATPAKGKGSKGAASVKVAEKSSVKSKAKASDGKKGKSGVQVAEARNTRK
jgi:hypothetical protein